MKESPLVCEKNLPICQILNVSPSAVLSWGSEPDAFSCHNPIESKIGFVREIADSNQIIAKQCSLSDWQTLKTDLPDRPGPDQESILYLIQDYLAWVKIPGPKYLVVDFDTETELETEMEKMTSEGFQMNQHRDLPTGMYGWRGIKYNPRLEEKIIRYPFAGAVLTPEYKFTTVRELYHWAVVENNKLIGIEFQMDSQNKFIGFIQYQKELKKSLIKFCPLSELSELSEVENQLFYGVFDGRLQEVQRHIIARCRPWRPFWRQVN